MEKDKILIVISLIIAILLFFYGLVSIFYSKKIKESHEKSLKKANNIISRYALEYSQKSKNDSSQRFSGFVALIMSIIMIYLFWNKLFSK